MELSRVGELEISHEPGFYRRQLVVQRIARVIGVLLFLAAIAGLFGEGPIAHASRSSSDGSLSVEYDRFVRTAASTFLKIKVSKGTGNTNVAISKNYLDKMNIGQISPNPSNVTQLPDRTVFTISQRPPAEVDIYIVPQKIGLHGGTIWTLSGKVSIHQFVYP